MTGTARLVGVVAVVAGMLLGAGCGGGSGPKGSTAGSGTPGASSSAAVPSAAVKGPGAVPQPKGGQAGPFLNAQSKFAQCLRQEGIALSAVKQPGLTPRQQIAVRKCGAFLPGGVNSGVLAAVDKFRACMKKHGAPLPPPNRPFVLRTEDPKVATAVRVCKSFLPSSGGTT